MINFAILSFEYRLLITHTKFLLKITKNGEPSKLQGNFFSVASTGQIISGLGDHSKGNFVRHETFNILNEHSIYAFIQFYNAIASNKLFIHILKGTDY